MRKIQTKDFKKRKKIVKEICDFYLSDSENKNKALEKIIECSYREVDYKYENILEAILWNLDYESRILIVNEFIPKENRYWINGYWSVKKYYEIKERAINTFADYLTRSVKNAWFFSLK